MVLEVHAAQMVHFCENFIKPKLKGTPENGGRVRSDQVLGVRWPVQLQGGLLQPWSFGNLVEIWQGDGNPPRKVSAHVWAGTPPPRVGGLKMGFKGKNLPKMSGLLGFGCCSWLELCSGLRL